MRQPPLEDVTVVVLAGGLGTRIRALHPTVPKPLVPVAGRPFLYWLTAYLARTGLNDFVYSTGYLGDQIAAWTADDTLPGLTRRARHETAPLGTGGGLLNCLDLCREWILVANGDSLCLGGVEALLAMRERTGLAGGVVGVFQEDAARYGSLDFDAHDGRLRRFLEKVPGRGYINSGLYLFRTQALAALQWEGPSSIEKDLIPGMLAAGERLEVAPVPLAPFIDIGTPETVAAGGAFIDAHGDQFAWPT